MDVGGNVVKLRKVIAEFLAQDLSELPEPDLESLLALNGRNCS